MVVEKDIKGKANAMKSKRKVERNKQMLYKLNNTAMSEVTKNNFYQDDATKIMIRDTDWQIRLRQRNVDSIWFLWAWTHERYTEWYSVRNYVCKICYVDYHCQPGDHI